MSHARAHHHQGRVIYAYFYVCGSRTRLLLHYGGISNALRGLHRPLPGSVVVAGGI